MTASYQSAALPADEQARLEELYRLGILDTGAEERFDRITQLVADLFEVPTAFISFIDRNRQWIKSACNPPFVETPRDVAFCAHALVQSDMLIIRDATQDPRFAHNPLVVGPPHIRFYAGAVLRGPGGHALGTLCLVDQTPRNLSEPERKRLLTIAHLVEQELRYEFRFKEIRRQAYRSAHYDAVTALPNANLLLDRVDQAITLARRSACQLLVAVVELPRLSETLTVIDKALGEQLLRACGAQLVLTLNPACTVARWRGESFAVLLPTVTHAHEAAAFLRLVRTAFREPIAVCQQTFQFEVLCGAAMYPDAGLDGETLMAAAQTMVRHSQQTPHAPFTFYTPEAGQRMKRRLGLEARLRATLAQGALDVVYQPIVNIDSGAPSAVEVLARWHDPVLGIVPTEEFIGLAEQSSLIVDIDRFVLERAVRDMAHWDAQTLSLPTVSVNISGRTLLQDDLPQWLQRATAGSRLAPNRIMLEITENFLLADMAVARRNIEGARALGFRFAIDDFGTGFSAFNYLTKLTVDEIKLDRVFIKEMIHRKFDASIARSIIAMTHDLGLPLVAEGVETYEQVVYLRAYNCKEAQGYYFSRPLTSEHLLIALQSPPGE